MNLIRVKKMALAIVSIAVIASNSLSVDAATVKAVSYEEEIVVAASTQQDAADKELRKLFIQSNYSMETKSADAGRIKNYILYRPDASMDEAKALIVYLHGTDGCGSDINKLFKIESVPSYINKGLVYPDAVVLAPQCPSGTNWCNIEKDVMQLIATVVSEQNIDPTRISITGCSLGGVGTYYIACKNPTFFSAVVPVCGSVNASKCSVLTDVPVWTFHGSRDTGMGFSCKEADKVINNNGGDSSLTMLEGEGHEIRHVYYDEQYDLLNWMSSQQREQ